MEDELVCLLSGLLELQSQKNLIQLRLVVDESRSQAYGREISQAHKAEARVRKKRPSCEAVQVHPHSHSPTEECSGCRSDEAAPPAAANGSAFQWPSRSPWPKRRRKQTISVALAASVVDIAQTLELATVLAGQLSRTAAIFNIDEVVVIDDADERG